MTSEAWRAAVEAVFDDAQRAAGDDALTRLLLATAERVCTRKQLSVLQHFLAGRSTVETGRAMGMSHAAAHNHLHGHPKHGGGALPKLRRAILNDEDLVREIVNVMSHPPAPQSETVTAWFAGVPPSRVHLFGPLAVLLVAEHLADARRSLTVADLCLCVPKPVVAAAIPILRTTGYIATDGVGITIRRTPIDEMRKAKEST